MIPFGSCRSLFRLTSDALNLKVISSRWVTRAYENLSSCDRELNLDLWRTARRWGNADYPKPPKRVIACS